MGHRVAWREQAGFGLIEVMVTCMVVVFIATATVTSIASSQKQSAKTVARGITANLADQDQERMKAMRATDLAGYTATRTVAQQGVNYQVDSSTEFVQSANGAAVSCTSTGSQSSYMRLTTTVTPQVGTQASPLTVNSLYALPIAQYSPTSGTLVVQIYAADGVTGQPGIPVTITGPDSRSATTNSMGCAIFQFLTPGAYAIDYTKPGYVDQNLDNTPSFTGTVTPANINQATPQIYDRAGSVTATFDSATTSLSPGITLAQSGLPVPGSLTSASRAVTGLFPFTGPYLAYSGTCAANDPSLYDPAYYTTTNAAAKAILPAGGGVGVNVHEPTIRTTSQVKDKVGTAAATTAPRTNMKLYLKAMDPGCGSRIYGPFTPSATTGVWQGNLPYGDYDVCTEWVKTTSGTGSGGTFSFTDTSVPNTVFGGTANHTLTVDTTLSANQVKC